MGIGVNRSYKDSVFRKLFGTEEYKENALALYNAINGTNYTNKDDLELNTLDDVIYMGIKNDASFIIDDELNLWEHQSSPNPNMPLRGLMYFARLYDGIINKNEWNVYGKRQIRLPRPKYYVFYNGEEERPERYELKFSDSYDGDGDIEVRATVINANYGNNKSIMDACKALNGYSIFVQRVRENKKNGLAIEEAVTQSINDCVRDGILADFLSKHKKEVRDMFLTEYDEVKTMSLFREEGYEEGRAEGRTEGGTTMVYAMVQDGDISLEKGAKRLGVTVEQLVANMLNTGYKLPE